MENKDVNGLFYKVVREEHGLLGIHAVTIKNGKVTDVKIVDASYPEVTKMKLVKFAFGQAMAESVNKV